MNISQRLLLLFNVGILILSGFTSCEPCIDARGPVVVQDRETGTYTKLELDIAADVSVIPGTDLFIRIHAQESLMDVIRTEVSGKTLVIRSKSCIRSDKPIGIELTVPSLSSVKVNGSGSVILTEMMNTENFRIRINGSGDFTGDVTANSVNAGINGSGDIIFNGSTSMLEVEINGSGDFRGLGLKSFEADVTIRGSGDVDINTLNKLRVEVFGSGDVRYVGNPAITSSVKGSGQVSKKN